MGEGLKRAFKAARATRLDQDTVTKLVDASVRDVVARLDWFDIELYDEEEQQLHTLLLGFITSIRG